MSGAYVHTVGMMGTVVTMQIVGHDATEHERREREAAVAAGAILLIFFGLKALGR